METTAIHRADRGALQTLVLTCGIFLAAGTMLSSLGPYLPFLAESSRMDLASLGWIFTTFSGGVVLTQAGFGIASARLGLRGVLATGTLLMGSGILAVSLVSSLPILLVLTGIAGAGFGGVIAAGNVLVARLFVDRSATALNGVNVFFGVGAVIGPLIVGQAGTRLGLPQLALWVGGGLILLFSPLVLWRASAPTTELRPATRSSSAGRRAVRLVLLLGLLLLIYIGTEVGFAGWVTAYMQQSAGLDLSNAALVASGFWLALSVGRMLGAALGMRISARSLLLTTLSGLLVGAALMALSVGNPGLSLTGAMLFGLACGPVFPTVIALITTIARGDDRIAGLALGIGNCGGLVLPALFGLLLTGYGPSTMIGLVLACTAVMLALGAYTLREEGS
jgi:fucose permease